MIRLRWTWSATRLELILSDPGHFEPPPDWDQFPKDPFAEGGRGGFLISSYVDHVEHLNSSVGHELILVKTTAEGPQAANVAVVEEELPS